MAPWLVRSLGVLATVVLLSCGGEPDGTTSVGSAGTEPPTPSPSTPSWRWQGLVIGPIDGAAQACLGDIAPSDPPHCTGWPLAGFDWSAVPWSKTYPTSRTASVQLVGHPEGEVFVLDEPPLPPDPNWTPPPCELIYGRTGDAISPVAAFELIGSAEATRAGVWMEPGLSGVSGDPAVSGDIYVGLVFSDDASSAWLVDHLPGLRIQVCPQMRPAGEPWPSAEEPMSSTTGRPAATTIPTPNVPLPTGPVGDPAPSVVSDTTTTSAGP